MSHRRRMRNRMLLLRLTPRAWARYQREQRDAQDFNRALDRCIAVERAKRANSVNSADPRHEGI